MRLCFLWVTRFSSICSHTVLQKRLLGPVTNLTPHQVLVCCCWKPLHLASSDLQPVAAGLGGSAGISSSGLRAIEVQMGPQGTPPRQVSSSP